MGAAGYRVTTPLNQALFGFGDAVCVDAVAWIAENYLNRFAEASRRPAEKVSPATPARPEPS
jgi:DNA (cytosine-5)-methyltransferase 1